MTDHLLRARAPISDAGWELLDREAKERLAPALAARKLVDFSGPAGWEHSATNLGRTAPLAASPGDGVSGLERRVLALVELRGDFELSRDELRDADRGAADVDLEALDAAAHHLATAENAAVFHGLSGTIAGIGEVTPHQPLPFASADELPARIAEATERLLSSGIGGPFGLALAPEQYRMASGGSESGGYPITEHLSKILGGPIVWTPGLTGGLVLSLRGGDFLFESGQDLSIGYDSHTAETVHLYLEESFSFRVATPEAAVALSAAG